MWEQRPGFISAQLRDLWSMTHAIPYFHLHLSLEYKVTSCFPLDTPPSPPHSGIWNTYIPENLMAAVFNNLFQTMTHGPNHRCFFIYQNSHRRNRLCIKTIRIHSLELEWLGIDIPKEVLRIGTRLACAGTVLIWTIPLFSTAATRSKTLGSLAGNSIH